MTLCHKLITYNSFNYSSVVEHLHHFQSYIKCSDKEIYKNTAVPLLNYVFGEMTDYWEYSNIDVYFPAIDFIWSLTFIQYGEWLSLEGYKIANIDF